MSPAQAKAGTTPRPQPKAAWARLPNEVARDKRLSDAGLVRTAYRATFAGTYALNATALLRKPIVCGAGFGRDVIERATAESVDCGYLERWQPRRAVGKTFDRAIEKLTLPPCGASGKAGRMVYRKWFDATLSVHEMAAYLYLRAGTGRGPGTYAAELAERFGWSRPTATKVIKALMGLGLLAKCEMRAANGQVRGISYHALPPVLWQAEPLSKNRGTVRQGAVFQGAYLDNPLHELTWLGRNGGLAPTSLPLFQGLRGAGLSATGD